MNHLSKSRRILFLIAAMLSNIAVMGDSVLYPISNSLYQTFPNATGMVNYILSGPPLLIVVTSVLTPYLLKKISKRTAMICGSTLFTIGAVFGVLIESPIWMAAMRTLVGIGQGMINVCSVSLICEVYTDEAQRSRCIGYFNASMNVIGMVFGYLAGIIAASSRWQNNFLLYLTSIPMLVMVILFIPKLDEPAQEKSTGASTKKVGLGADFWEMDIVFFLIATLCMVSSYFLSVYVAENALGTETLSGTALSLGQLASFVMAVLFGTLYGKFKRFMCTGSIILAIVGLAIWYFTTSPATVYATAIIQAVAYLLLYSYSYARAPEIVPVEKIDTAIGIVTATMGISSFASTYFVTFLMNVMKTDSFTQIIGVLPIVAVIVLIGDTVYMVFERKRRVML